MEKPTAEQIALQFEFAGYLRNPELKQTTGELWNLATGGKCCLGHLCDFVLSKAPEPDKIGRWDLGDVYAKFEWLDADGKRRALVAVYRLPNPKPIKPTLWQRLAYWVKRLVEENARENYAETFNSKR